MKSIQVQRTRNGLLLSVRTSSGEDQYIVPDDGSTAYKSFCDACDAALDTVKEPAPDPDPEFQGEFSNPGPHSHVGGEDEPSLFEAANTVLEHNPHIKDLIGGFFNGLNNAERKRAEGLRRREEELRRRREEKK